MTRATIRWGEFLIFLGALFLFLPYAPWGNFSPAEQADLIIYGGIGLLVCFGIAYFSRWFVLDEIVHLGALVIGAGLITLVLHMAKWEGLELGDLGGPFSQVRENDYSQTLSPTVTRPAIEVQIRNGEVRLRTDARRTDYTVRVRTRVRGWSDARMRELLDAWHTAPQLREDGLSLVQETSAPTRWGWYSVRTDVQIVLPQSPSYRVTLRSTNGRLRVEDLSATEIVLTTTNSSIIVERVTAQSVNMRSTNGSLRGTLDVANFTGTTTNGSIDLTLTPTTSGRYQLRTTNGRIGLELPHPGAGYAIAADVSNGRVSVKLRNFQAAEQSRRRVRGETAHFSAAAVQVRIEASTTNGSIEIKD
jgi:hypothetical protein